MWISHIVIMHKQSLSGEPSLRPMEWRPDGPMPDRTDEEALSRAIMVARMAASDPSAFAQLAKTYSDDRVTRDSGGSLGGVRAGQLPAEYRDALAVLKPGETSRVVRTALGYSVLRRRPPPPNESVAGRRIVIRYRGTVGGSHGIESNRERAAALELAARVTGQARSGPVSFEHLVEEYSESVDAAQSGDIGVWFLLDPGFMPREIERLGQLKVGEVSSVPLESIFGFEILLRTEASARPRYAMRAVQIPYDPTQNDDQEHSRAGALRLATDLARQLRADPSKFDGLLRQYCCDKTDQWTLGRGPVGVSPALDRLSFGEIAADPVEANWSYVIPQRIDPSSLPDPPPPLYELPSPKGPDLETLVKSGNGAVLAIYTRFFATDLQKLLSLPRAEVEEIAHQIEQLAASFEKNATNPSARVESVRAAISHLQTRLGPKDYEVFDTFLTSWSTRVVLTLRGPKAGMVARQPR
jgi:parvulin-like peptidyl-prolyl isomerase